MKAQRELYCPRVEAGETDLLAHSPVPSTWKRRPRGALLQSAAAVWVWMCSV